MRHGLLALMMVGCSARHAATPRVPAGDAIALYRDRALVVHRADVVAASAGPVSVAFQLAAGVAPTELAVIDAGGLAIASVRIADASSPPAQPAPAARRGRRSEDEPADDPAPPPDEPEADVPRPPRLADDPANRSDQPAVLPIPTEVTLTVDAPRAGRYSVLVAYTSDRLGWDAAYTMTTDAARDRVSLRGALAIRNTTGVALHGRIAVVDSPIGSWRVHADDQLAFALGAPPTDDSAAGAPGWRDLGARDLAAGDTQVELLAGEPARAMRSVLVYDPVGSHLDRPTAMPAFDPKLGTEPAPPRVSESFEVERDERAEHGLPAGPVRLYEQRADGSLALLGEARLFEAASRGARVDTIPIGTADGLTGHRERRDWLKDSAQKRLSEELLVTIDNARGRAVDVVIREHLYRGQNWTLAYQSARATKEGPQQIALRTTVPANGQAKVLYVVVYTW
jgi:hypothetical protein